MVDIYSLKNIMKNSGMSMTHIAKQSGISRETLYNRLNGVGEFSASEIVAMSKVLNMSKKERNEIFLNEKLN